MSNLIVKLRPLCVLALFLACTACKSKKTDVETDSTHVSISPLLRLSGSNTIGAELAPSFAEEWLKSKGATNLHRENMSKPDEIRVVGQLNGSPVSIEIRAHGSATAFPDLASDVADIGMASRPITADEAKMLAKVGKGDPRVSNANQRVVGLDGIAIVVHETSNLDNMTKNQIAEIFTGKASQDWHVYSMDNRSGTYDTFKSMVLGKGSLVDPDKNRFEDGRKLVSAVAQDPKGIGFVGLPYAVGVKRLAVAATIGADAQMPNKITVRKESYPLSRRLYFYLTDAAKPEARAFAGFAVDHQEIVEKIGFVGQIIEQVHDEQAPRGISGDSLSEAFRFRPGSSVLDSKAMDGIERVVAFLNKQSSGKSVGLVGFADNTGTPQGNLALSKDRAEAVAKQMERQGIEVVFTVGMGQANPVADNNTLDGREKNRRVEVWRQR